MLSAIISYRFYKDADLNFFHSRKLINMFSQMFLIILKMVTLFILTDMHLKDMDGLVTGANMR